jgi:hypothetical protein
MVCFEAIKWGVKVTVLNLPAATSLAMRASPHQDDKQCETSLPTTGEVLFPTAPAL